MNFIMIICAIVLLTCVTTGKLLYKFGVPLLIVFIILGMLMGSDGIGGIYFSDYEFAKNVCSFALVIIMFYGGFGTRWETAKPVAVPTLLLASVGTFLTAAVTGLFCHFVLKISVLEGLLFGSVIASTDAASVFSVLRSRKLNLKGGLAPLLEMESGSNDPFSYMMTITILTIMSGKGETSILKLIVMQLGLGVILGVALAIALVFVLRRVIFEIEGLYPIFLTAVVILGFALCEIFGGNSFLCVYIIGLIAGNSKIFHKKMLVHFFDGISWFMQIMLFFVVGLLSFPSQLPAILVSGICISVFIIVVARPLAVFGVLSWFKLPIKHMLFISWVGYRGAASIVFSIIAITYDVAISNDIYHIVFFVALFSVLVQGSLTPLIARKLDVIDPESTELKTFTDYTDTTHTKLMEFKVTKSCAWVDKTIMEANIPEEILVVLLKRAGTVIVPKGSTKIEQDDILVLNGDDFSSIRAIVGNT